MTTITSTSSRVSWPEGMRAGEPALPLNGCSIQESNPHTSPGQLSRVDPGGPRKASELIHSASSEVQIQGSEFPASAPPMNCGEHDEGSTPGDPKLQDQHNTGQQALR